MGKKRILAAITLSLILISLVCGVPFGKEVKANPHVFALMPRIYINLPLNQTYTTSSVQASAIIELREQIYYNNSSQDIMEFYLDSKDDYKMFRTTAIRNGTTPDGWMIFYGETTIENLTDGAHELSIGFSSATLGTVYNPVARFTIDTDASEPTPMPSPTTTPNPTASPTPSASPSPTQQPIQEPAQAASSTPWRDVFYGPDLTPLLTGLVTMFTLGIAGAIFYFKVRKQK